MSYSKVDFLLLTYYPAHLISLTLITNSFTIFIRIRNNFFFWVPTITILCKQTNKIYQWYSLTLTIAIFCKCQLNIIEYCFVKKNYQIHEYILIWSTSTLLVKSYFMGILQTHSQSHEKSNLRWMLKLFIRSWCTRHTWHQNDLPFLELDTLKKNMTVDSLNR